MEGRRMVAGEKRSGMQVLERMEGPRLPVAALWEM